MSSGRSMKNIDFNAVLKAHFPGFSQIKDVKF